MFQSSCSSRRVSIFQNKEYTLLVHVHKCLALVMGSLTKVLDSYLLCFWTRITSSVQIESRGTHSE